jgi:hypothetical protein
MSSFDRIFVRGDTPQSTFVELPEVFTWSPPSDQLVVIGGG